MPHKNFRAEAARDGFKYATWLKSQGYATAVHALPAEVRQMINEMLSQGWRGKKIASEVNQRYGETIKAIGLKPISHSVIDNYHAKFYRKSNEYSRNLQVAEEKEQGLIAKAMRGYDAVVAMIELAKKQQTKADMLDDKEDAVKMPMKRGDDARRLAFDMHERVISKLEELGYYKREPVLVEHTGDVTVTHEYEAKEVISLAKEALNAIELDGSYVVPEISGDQLGTTPQGSSQKEP